MMWLSYDFAIISHFAESRSSDRLGCTRVMVAQRLVFTLFLAILALTGGRNWPTKFCLNLNRKNVFFSPVFHLRDCSLAFLGIGLIYVFSRQELGIYPPSSQFSGQNLRGALRTIFFLFQSLLEGSICRILWEHILKYSHAALPAAPRFS